MKAVPLSLITRLEEIERDTIEHCNGEDVVQYRGALMPLVYMQDEARGRAGGVQPVLVFTEGGKPVGLAIDEIVDIVEEQLEIELKTETPGVIGAAIVKGKAAGDHRCLALSRPGLRPPARYQAGRRWAGRSGFCWSTTASSSATCLRRC